jgi:hypothetical protein
VTSCAALAAWITASASPAAAAPAICKPAKAGKKKNGAEKKPAAEKKAEPEEAPPPAPPPASEEARALQRGERVEFDGRLIQGQTAKAGAVYLFARVSTNLKSMVKERSTFREKIVRTVFAGSSGEDRDEANTLGAVVAEKKEEPPAPKEKDERRDKRSAKETAP